ncbi:MAG TPA: tRNA (adenosine(37)-N6)-threonylcarbamoyltransferase complex dimerization subunit type 1 TsaB [Lachnospiraceae bacterium]|jgi:tRNA threonylcarbamoyl adenosine modification protein YeaZ|nr:tRNA (adenosine(37)-N6)-threonylcarbamoyltransferase complex dimerization subunit type 1 TsaB [Lachnospiraceae bacterium]
MKILALDASGQVASIALAEDDKLLGEYTMNTKKTHSQTLLPMVDALLHLIGEDKNTIDAVAVAGGPGSFTGLRIGSATAKGLSYAWGVPIISVPTVDALAYNMVGSDGLICPVLDARRQQTYTGIYAFHANADHAQEMEVLRPECAVKIEEIVADLNERGEKVTFLGDGVPVFASYIEENLKVPYTFAPLHRRLQSASSLVALAMEYAKAGRMEKGEDHRPNYLRETQAERERKAKIQ